MHGGQATVVKADKIVVLHGGRVAEEGTHADLVAKGGVYANLIHTQMLAGDGGGG